MMYSYGLGGGFAGAWLLMGLFWLALIGLAIYFVVKLAQPSSPANSGDSTAAESPEQIVDRLFARGEIDEPTYRARRQALAEMRKTK